MLTRVGRNTLLASAALYGAALALGYPELAVPASAGITALGAALITVARRPRLLVTLSVTPARVSRGQQVAARVALKNGGESWSPRFALSLPHGAGTARMAAGRLAKHGSWEIPLLLRCDRRGLVKIGPLTIEQGDVFGLCRRVQIAADAVTVHVHPVVYPLPLPSARRLRHAEGISSPQAPDGGITFHSLREYVPGDDLRYVHWLASAKNAGGSGSLLVRRHVDPGDVSSAVILDTCARSYPANSGRGEEPFEAAVDLAASVLTASARNGFQVHLHTTGGTEVLTRPGREGMGRMLDALAKVQAGSQDPALAIRAVLGSMRAHSSRSATVTWITGADGDVPGAALTRLCRWHQRVILARIGPAAAGSPASSQEMLPSPGRVHAFAAATGAEAAGKWATIVTSGRARRW